jgi:hypothetical protein
MTEPDAGAWLKPGAWGCKTKERIYPKRRGFRTVMRSSLLPAIWSEMRRGERVEPVRRGLKHSS